MVENARCSGSKLSDAGAHGGSKQQGPSLTFAWVASNLLGLTGKTQHPPYFDTVRNPSEK